MQIGRPLPCRCERQEYYKFAEPQTDGVAATIQLLLHSFATSLGFPLARAVAGGGGGGGGGA